MRNLTRRILVVEDDPAVSRAVSRWLTQRGFSVQVVRTCEAAIACQQHFDSAVLDVDLPDGNGVDLGAELIARGVVPQITFFTGSRDSELLARARSVGEVLSKAHGTPKLFALLAADTIEAPKSHTIPRAKGRAISASSGARRSRSN
jgi:DNA-binding response OmpR family regulator